MIKDIYSNLKMVFVKPRHIVLFVILLAIFASLWYYFTDFELLRGNYGDVHFYVDLFTSWMNIIGFALFIVVWIYRSYTLGMYTQKKDAF